MAVVLSTDTSHANRNLAFVTTKNPGTEFCIDCEQFFCMNCKSLHKRMKGTKNHEFQSGGNIVPEVRLRCEEHKEVNCYLFRDENFKN
jgi:hypothetical protein